MRELICAYGGSEGWPLTTAGISPGDGPVSWDMESPSDRAGGNQDWEPWPVAPEQRHLGRRDTAVKGKKSIRTYVTGGSGEEKGHLRASDREESPYGEEFLTEWQSHCWASAAEK